MSHNDDFWSGSHNDDPHGEQPTEQRPYFGDPVFGQHPAEPTAAYPLDPNQRVGQRDPHREDPYRQDPYQQDPYRHDPYQQDPYQQESGRRRLLNTGPHQLDDSWGPGDESYDPGQGYRRDEYSARRGGRGGFIAVFIAAAFLVALAAGAYAVYSVLSDTDDFAATESTTTTALETTTTLGTTTTASTLPPGMNIQLVADQFICDGEVRAFGLITGAEPNEEVAFTSPQSPNLRAGQADENGRLPIRWSCTAEQVGTTWELTATGAISGQSITTSFTGVEVGTVIEERPTTTTTAPTTTVVLGEFSVVLTENPFTCNGEVRVFGTLSGATPNGQISFTSPQASDIRSGTADETGSRPIRWSCTPEQAGTVWELTATDDSSGRSITFRLSGQ